MRRKERFIERERSVIFAPNVSERGKFFAETQILRGFEDTVSAILINPALALHGVQGLVRSLPQNKFKFIYGPHDIVARSGMEEPFIVELRRARVGAVIIRPSYSGPTLETWISLLVKNEMHVILEPIGGKESYETLEQGVRMGVRDFVVTPSFVERVRHIQMLITDEPDSPQEFDLYANRLVNKKGKSSGYGKKGGLRCHTIVNGEITDTESMKEKRDILSRITESIQSGEG